MKTTLVLTVMVTLALGSVSHATLITIPTSGVTASSEIPLPFNRLDDYLVDGSGLSGGQHTMSVQPNMWLSAGIGFGGADPDPSVTFDLGAVYTINSFHVWNYNEAPPNFTNRGVNGVTVEYGTSAALGAAVPGITNFAQADGLDTYAGENFSGFTPFDARYIKFDIASGVGVGNHGDANSFYGLSEVQFDGLLAIPEPSSLGLFALGGLGLFPRRRLHARRQG